MLIGIWAQSKQLNVLFKPGFVQAFSEYFYLVQQRINKTSVMMSSNTNSSFRPVQEILYSLRIYLENTEKYLMLSYNMANACNLQHLCHIVCIRLQYLKSVEKRSWKAKMTGLLKRACQVMIGL